MDIDTRNDLTDQARSIADRIDGDVLLPTDAGYDDARSVWNAMVDRRPRVIVRCMCTDDVVTALAFARDHDLEVGVRCGGHGIVGHAVPEDGLMIDLTPMGAVRVDPQRRLARVQGGALLAELDRAAQEHGLATTAGNVSHTGVGGLTLGGGMGWLARQVGLACDNVMSFEVVTAAGDIIRASETEHPDLYWGLRGGGGNFGIVTEFEFRLHPVGTRALLADFYYPIEHAGPVLRQWRDLNASAPRQATFVALVAAGPAFLPGDLPGTPLVSVGFVWVGDPDEASGLLSTVRDLGVPVAERVEELSYVDLQRMGDSDMAHAVRRYYKGQYFRELSDEAIEAFLQRGSTGAPDERLPAASLQAYGGAIADVPESGAAFSHRDTQFELVMAAGWEDPADDERWMSGVRRCAAALEPFEIGAYVNTLGDDGAAGVSRAYPPDKLARLTELKDAYDPENVFHLNQNIPPSPPA